jgi:hypothetical protein
MLEMAKKDEDSDTDSTEDRILLANFVAVTLTFTTLSSLSKVDANQVSKIDIPIGREHIYLTLRNLYGIEEVVRVRLPWKIMRQRALEGKWKVLYVVKEFEGRVGRFVT